MFFCRGEEMGCERPSSTAFKHRFWRGRRVRNASVASVMSVKPLFVRRAPPALEHCWVHVCSAVSLYIASPTGRKWFLRKRKLSDDQSTCSASSFAAIEC